MKGDISIQIIDVLRNVKNFQEIQFPESIENIGIDCFGRYGDETEWN